MLDERRIENFEGVDRENQGKSIGRIEPCFPTLRKSAKDGAPGTRLKLHAHLEGEIQRSLHSASLRSR